MKNIIFKWRYFFIIGLIFAGIFAILYFTKTSPKFNIPTKKQEETKKELTTEDELKFQEQVGEIIKTDDLGGCEKVENDLYRRVCVNNIALNLAHKKQDISYCQKIDNELVPRDDCERQVISEKSLEKEDVGVCLETKNQELQKLCQESFYYQLALKKEDINICGRAAAQEQMDFCRNFFIITKNAGQNFETLDCLLLKGEDAMSDCRQMKELLQKKKAGASSVPGGPDFEACVGLKTALFRPFCLQSKP